MGLLDDVLADETQHIIDADESGESVTYLKQNGRTRSITAVVERRQPQVRDETGRNLGPSFRITVENNATRGITSTELDTGGDQIRLPRRHGQSTTIDVKLSNPVHQDAGALVFEVNP